MSLTRAELVFVAGPQQGQRVRLLDNVMVAGRGPLAQIQLQEETVSRQQLQLELTVQGWLVQNLSAGSPLRINGKKYKVGKQILVDSGDVIGLGLDTEILFVDADTDVNEAMRAYTEDNPAPEPVPVPVTPELAPEPVSHVPDLAAQPTTYLDVPQEQEAPQTDEEADEAARKAKIKKIAIGFGIYLALMVVAAVFLVSMKKAPGPNNDGVPASLSSEEIRDALEQKIVKEPNPVASQKHLQEARRLFDARTQLNENLYLCHKHYRLALAFRRRADRYFKGREDQRKSEMVLDELSERLGAIYSGVMLFEKGNEWYKAGQELDRFCEYLPSDKMKDDPDVKDTLWKNTWDHRRYIRTRLGGGND